MKKIEVFDKRLRKIGIKIEMSLNLPFVYLNKVNGKTVSERFKAEHGFTIMFIAIKPQGEDKFTDLKEIFKIIRKYGR